MLLCPNGPQTSLIWFNKVDNMHALRVGAYCPNVYTVCVCFFELIANNDFVFDCTLVLTVLATDDVHNAQRCVLPVSYAH